MSFISDEQMQHLSDISHQAFSYRSFEEFVEKILKFLIDCGFDTARYYDIVYDRATNDDSLVLSALGGNRRYSAAIGYKISFKSSTLGMAADQRFPVIGRSKNTNQSWQKELGLAQPDSCWVDIPVNVNGERKGLLAADWVERKPGDLTKADLGILGMLGALTAGVLEVSLRTHAEKIESEVGSTLNSLESVDEALFQTAQQLSQHLDFGVVAIFQYSWISNRLRKIFEVFHPSIETAKAEFPEEYEVGRHLTGLAWNKPSHRHIVNFPALMECKDSHEIKTDSFDRHTAFLGKISSILYGKLESKEPKYLIRVMNIVNTTRPIVTADKVVLDKICLSLAQQIDRLVGNARLSRLRLIAQESARSVTKPENVAKKILDGVRGEGFEELIVMCCHKGTTGGSIFSFSSIKGFDSKTTAASLPNSWAESDALTELANADRLALHSISKFSSDSTKPIWSMLSGRGLHQILSVPISTPTIQGCLIIPVPTAHGTGREAAPIAEKYRDTKSLLETFSAIMGSCVEGQESHVTAEGARKFVGRIGHEVKTPMVDAVNASLEALAHVEGALFQATDGNLGKEAIENLLTGINEQREKIDSCGGEIEQIMELAKFSALNETGDVHMNFKEIDLFSLIKRVQVSLENNGELLFRDQHDVMRKCEITFNKGANKLGTIIADEAYLKVVFSNLLRNAAKYSLPRFTHKPATIQIEGEPQEGMTIVRITNWGLGIKSEEFEAIFRPFFRGSVLDTRKSISGLGVGLYLCRALINAHQGSIICQKSESTLDDNIRRNRHEGFVNVFEVRLPRILPKGTRVVSL